jgi:hypothetical protein
VRAVSLSLLVLGLAAALQALFAASGSIALLADLIHNGGDALTAVPLGVAFMLRSRRAEGYAGLAVVTAIFISATIAGIEAVHRLIDPSAPTDLWALAAAGVEACQTLSTERLHLARCAGSAVSERRNVEVSAPAKLFRPTSRTVHSHFAIRTRTATVRCPACRSSSAGRAPVL